MEQKKKNDFQWRTVKKVLRYIGRFRLYLMASLLFAFLTVVLTLLAPRLTGAVVDHMIGAGRVDFHGVRRIMLQLVLAAAGVGIFQWCMNLCNNHLAYAVVQALRNDAFRKIERLPLSYLDAHPVGEIESRVIADADQFSDGLLMGFTQLFTGVLTILGTLLFMLSVNVWITLAVVLITPLSFLLAGYISKHSYILFRAQSTLRGEQTGMINEMVEGQRVVKAFHRERAVISDFDALNEKLTETSLKATFFSSLTNPTTRFVNALVYMIVGAVGALSVIGGHLTVGELTAFLSYASQYAKPFNEISGVVTELQNAIACAARLFEFIEEAEEVPDAAAAKAPERFDGAVGFDKVAFSYVPEQHLIENFDFAVKPEQKIAIVGPTGCGKTTLINLLMRFYDVTGGSITLDGTDLRDLTRASLRGGFGMVLQETWLKSGTIRENITMGNPGIREERMREVARICHIANFIEKLPQGYDTVIAENGEGFSQGQKQLLCIARVMMSNPSMLILDEATSSIDTRTELKIQEAFNKLMEGRTSFIVAHRLSTIRNADVILVMKAGHIIEKGNHEELMAAKGFYYTLYESQFLGKSI